MLNLAGGGSNQSLHLYATMMSQRGHDVTVITVGDNTNTVDHELTYEHITCPERTAATPLGRLREMKKLFSEHEHCTDIYHSFNTIFHPAAGFYRLRGGEVPVVGRLNTYSMFCSNMSMMDDECHRSCTVGAKFRHSDDQFKKKLVEIPSYILKTYTDPQLVNNIDRLFAVSPAVKEIYTNIGIDGDVITALPSPYDPDFTTDTGNLFNGRSDFTLLYIGRLVPRKGVDILLDAVANINRVDIEIVGDGSQLSELQQRVSRLELEDNVTFHGWVDYSELSSFYRQSDLFVQPSRWPEPLSRTIIESLQHETPVLVSDIGGSPWLAGEAGATFEPDNSRNLRQTIRQIMTDESWYDSMQSSCSEELQKVDPHRVANLLEREYERAISVAD